MLIIFSVFDITRKCDRRTDRVAV